MMADRFSSDGVEVTCLVDGATSFGADTFPEIDAAETQARLEKAGLTAAGTHFNAYLLRHAGGLDLVDTGCGSQFGPIAGRLTGALAAMDVTPAQIDRIFLTHLHTDHAGGLMDGDAVRFPTAQIVLHRKELDYWRGRDALRDTIIAAYRDRMTVVDDDQDMGQGLRIWGLAGHTPGHMGLRIGRGLVLTGDIIHSEALQLGDIATRNAYDSDRVLAEASRLRALDEICDKALVWSGSHMFAGPKFARLCRAGNGYQRLPL